MTGPFPVGGGPRLQCLVVAEAGDVAAWSAGLAAAGWEVVGTVLGADVPGVDVPGVDVPGVDLPGAGAPDAGAPDAGGAGLQAALAGRRVHALVVGTPGRAGARWPASALATAVDRALHAVVPWQALPAAGSDALAGRAQRSGAVVLVHGDRPAGAYQAAAPVTLERARAVGEVLRRRVTGLAAPVPGPDTPPVRPLGEAAR